MYGQRQKCLDWGTSTLKSLINNWQQQLSAYGVNTMSEYYKRTLHNCSIDQAPLQST